MSNFNFRRVVLAIFLFPLIYACEEREVLSFEDLYTDDIKALYDDVDPCENVTRNSLEIKTVPINEGRQLQRRPYQILNINNGSDTYLLFGKHNSDGELSEENILVIDSEDGMYRNLYHFSCPLDDINNFSFTNGSCFLQIFQYEKRRDRLSPRVVELVYINKADIFSGAIAYDFSVNIVEIDIETLQPEKSIFYLAQDNQGDLDQISPFDESGSALLGDQTVLLCGERRLFEACSSRLISVDFAYSSIDEIPFTNFLQEHITTLSPSFFRVQETPDFYKPLIEPWLKAVRQEKVFDQVACFYNSFEMQNEVDFKFDFDN